MISPKMSTYLLAWAVGEFDYIQATTKGEGEREREKGGRKGIGDRRESNGRRGKKKGRSERGVKRRDGEREGREVGVRKRE
jgi:hypothetical protein